MTGTLTAPARDAVDHVRVDNALARYHGELSTLLRATAENSSCRGFTPGFDLPPLDHRLESFFAPSGMSWHRMDPACRGLSLLDLRENPATRTTKTNASLLMVARAVAYIRRTGERIVIVTPSSANKATALRDAVWRAIDCGLVDERELMVVCVVPIAAIDKLWSSPLAGTPERRRRNPILTLAGMERDGVKRLVQAFADGAPWSGDNVQAWFTMSLENYRVADAVRAFVEQDHLPAGRRTHAHAVSSAFGLLGHAYGVAHRRADTPPYFLVQHLETPDMVLHLQTGGFDRSGLPDYRLDPATGLYEQDTAAHFPATTFDPAEVLEPTFYTRAPATAPEMTQLIRESGGGGIVVSLHECLGRYGRLRQLVAEAGIDLPADPRELHEWSLVMVLTGVLNARERGLLSPDTEVLVHASGSYGTADFHRPPPGAVHPIGSANDLAAHVTEAARQ